MFGLPYVLENGCELKACLRMSPLKLNMSQPSEMFIAREIMHKFWQYQIQRFCIDHYFEFLKSDTAYCFAYISAL